MNDNHLPIYGVGPLLIIPIMATSVIAIILTIYKIIPVYTIYSITWLLNLIAICIIIYGALFWILAVKSRIDEKIKANQLETTGIYGIVRHPIYAAFLYISTGLIIFSNNLYLFFLPVLYWIFLTVSIKNTEEKWLIKLYGDDYMHYSKKVNRFFWRF